MRRKGIAVVLWLGIKKVNIRFFSVDVHGQQFGTGVGEEFHHSVLGIDVPVSFYFMQGNIRSAGSKVDISINFMTRDITKTRIYINVAA